MPKHEITPKVRVLGREQQLESELLGAHSQWLPTTSGHVEAVHSGWLLEDILLSGHAPAWMSLACAQTTDAVALASALEEEFR
jgi:hypothetical protein